MGENICKEANNRGLISKINKQLMPLNTKNKQKKKQNKNKQPNLKMGRRSKQTFFQRRHTDGQKAHEKMLNMLIIREMQIKTTMRYHLTPARMPIIKRSTNNKCGRVCGEKGTFLHCWWECKLVQPLRRRVWRFLKKVKGE